MRILRIAAIVAACSLLLAGCSADKLSAQYRAGTGQNYIAGDGSVTEIAASNRGKPITFSGTTETGAPASSARYAGQVLVVNFWYAGCPPCRVEASSLEALNQQYGAQKVGFLGVNLYDSADTVLGFDKSFKVTYPSVLDRDTGSVLLAFSGSVPPKATPTTIVLDRKGRVAARILGGLPDRSTLDTLIRSTLAETD